MYTLHGSSNDTAGLPTPSNQSFAAGASCVCRRLSAQLVLCDAALQTLFNVTGVLFTTWFLIQLKDILIRDLILVRAIKSGRKELERVWTPLSSLMTWAAVLACGISICSSLGVNLEPLLAVGGAGGIAAGFASQQVLTNIVSGKCGVHTDGWPCLLGGWFQLQQAAVHQSKMVYAPCSLFCMFTAKKARSSRASAQGRLQALST